jgi:hypothetical protein
MNTEEVLAVTQAIEELLSPTTQGEVCYLRLR